MSNIPKNVEVRRQLTKQSIEINPVEIQIIRPNKEQAESGGFKVDQPGEGEELEPQTVRLHLHGRMRQVTENSSEGGTVREVDHWMLAKWDADIEPDDFFQHDNREFIVNAIRRQYIESHRVSLNVELRERGAKTV